MTDGDIKRDSCSLRERGRRLKNVIMEDMIILDIFRSLSDFFMLDFYTLEGHTLLPKSWLDCSRLGKHSFLKHICSLLIDKEEKRKPIFYVMPLSLICFIRLIKTRLQTRQKKESISPELPVSCKEQLRHLKPKKIIELKELLPLLNRAIARENITHIVDIGSGIGHVSRFIAAQNPDCYILRIEAQSNLIGKAKTIDQKFVTSNSLVNILSSVNFLKLDDNIADSFHSILKEVDDDNENCGFSDSRSRLLLLGLHPCGNLGSFMLKLFKESSLCKSIIIVSCCYLFIDTDNNQIGGFPLTKFLNLKDFTSLSGQLKEQACHNAESYLDRLIGFLEKPEELLTQHWRSIADIFICKRDPDYSRKCFKFKKRSNNEDIIAFINKNLTSHKLSLLNDHEGDQALKVAVVDQWKTWAYYLVYITKLLIGVVGESLILNDRLLYLIEECIFAEFNVLFNSMDSPRNTAIIAHKIDSNCT